MGSLHLRLLIRENVLKVDSCGDERKRMEDTRRIRETAMGEERKDTAPSELQKACSSSDEPLKRHFVSLLRSTDQRRLSSDASQQHTLRSRKVSFDQEGLPGKITIFLITPKMTDVTT